MLKFILLLFFILLSCSSNEINKSLPDYPISTIGIRNVDLNDEFWLPKIKIIQDSTIDFAIHKCEQEGRMENFLIAGKKKEGKTRGYMPFDDTDLYKIIEGASNSLISSPNTELEKYLDSLISIIKAGQEQDGYLTTWFTIDRKNPPASWVKPSEKRWENEVMSHELYNSGHLFEAAAAHFYATGKKNFLEIAIKNADLLVESFGPDKIRIPPGHQIVETGLIQLYRITKNQDYLNLAKFFLDIRGDSTTHKLYGEYSQDHLPVIEQKDAVGHSVRAVYMYAAMTDIAALLQDSAYFQAVQNLWHNVVSKKMYLTGGIGSRHSGEAFGSNYELPNLTAYGETCAAIGNVYWNQRLFMLTGDSKYVDIIERTLYNGLLSGISVDGQKFFYPNPLESDGRYEFNHGACSRSSWFDCSCCPTNLIRFLPSVPNLIYAVKNNDVYVNLFISNTSMLKVDADEIKIKQKTGYPWDGHINIQINTEKVKIFNLKLRIPGWAENNPVPGDLYMYTNKNKSELIVKVNGREQIVKLKNGYVELSRNWKNNARIELILPMKVHRVIANKLVEEDRNKVAFEYGPIVYCAEEIDNKNISNIKITKQLNMFPEEKTILGNKIIALNGMADDKPVTLIPYYLWSNRGIGKMKVWFPAD